MFKSNLNLFLSFSLCLTCLLPVFQFSANYDVLPEQIVSHYNVNMVADDTMAKIPFMVTMISMTMILGLGTGFGSIFIIKRSPSLLNLPNKDYWLSKENRVAALSTLSSYMLQIGILTPLLFTCIIQASIGSTLDPLSTTSPLIWVAISFFCIYPTGLIIALRKRFALKTPTND